MVGSQYLAFHRCAANETEPMECVWSTNRLNINSMVSRPKAVVKTGMAILRERARDRGDLHRRRDATSESSSAMPTQTKPHAANRHDCVPESMFLSMTC